MCFTGPLPGIRVRTRFYFLIRTGEVTKRATVQEGTMSTIEQLQQHSIDCKIHRTCVTNTDYHLVGNYCCRMTVCAQLTLAEQRWLGSAGVSQRNYCRLES